MKAKAGAFIPSLKARVFPRMHNHMRKILFALIFLTAATMTASAQFILTENGFVDSNDETKIMWS